MEALRTGLYEMLLVRDKYRELCGERGLYRGLALRWLEVEALLLSPVCPHVAEHLWALLGKTGSVLAATWPTAPAPDTTVIAQSEYLMDTARDFRLKLKNATTVKSKGKGKGETVPACPPTHATVYVARSCPAWQVTVLSTLAEMFAGNAETVVDNKAVSVRLGKLPELKKYMKKVMPFVAYTKDQVAIRGLEALDTQLPWDEVQVLTDNLSYLLATLDLEGVDVALSTELGGERGRLPAWRPHYHLPYGAEPGDATDQQPAVQWAVQPGLPGPTGRQRRLHRAPPRQAGAQRERRDGGATVPVD